MGKINVTFSISYADSGGKSRLNGEAERWYMVRPTTTDQCRQNAAEHSIT